MSSGSGGEYVDRRPAEQTALGLGATRVLLSERDSASIDSIRDLPFMYGMPLCTQHYHKRSTYIAALKVKQENRQPYCRRTLEFRSSPRPDSSSIKRFDLFMHLYCLPSRCAF